ncbi:MAG: DNA glycosylase [Verrucomicrobiota bacterium]|jgi:N-glycosylase/DNA lyase
MAGTEILLRVRDYDLAATLDSGQAFRWQFQDGSWTGVIGRHWVRLTQKRDGIRAETAGPVHGWQWLRDYLQTDVDLDAVLKTFPDDAPMRDAVAACRGLRVLRQDPWECLASFILSSTKQIVQIRQIVTLLCERFGEPIPVLGLKNGRAGSPLPAVFSSDEPRRGRSDAPYHSFAFPTPQRIAAASESELRSCKMGFRAPHLLAAARRIAEGKFDLERLRQLPLAGARAELTTLRGVGDKIADCVLLFAYGFDSAFPVDVWVERALRELYFPRRRVGDKRLRHFAVTHFGPHAGYAQQYLFHYMRTKVK